MKKLNLKLAGKEMLTKEQMKSIAGGDEQCDGYGHLFCNNVYVADLPSCAVEIYSNGLTNLDILCYMYLTQEPIRSVYCTC